MKPNKVIDLEEAIRKREATIIEKYLQKKQYEEINKIAYRQIWRKEKRHAEVAK
ncbi:MAG TPA: hypothetical protein VMW09_02460 [Desulfatiglandales bacterium]|nr:hypothetical protein [Desulfatiglandales bacterium]